jgi:hypothetical protein
MVNLVLLLLALHQAAALQLPAALQEHLELAQPPVKALHCRPGSSRHFGAGLGGLLLGSFSQKGALAALLRCTRTDHLLQVQRKLPDILQAAVGRNWNQTGQPPD